VSSIFLAIIITVVKLNKILALVGTYILVSRNKNNYINKYLGNPLLGSLPAPGALLFAIFLAQEILLLY
jgi:hypothetical protein